MPRKVIVTGPRNVLTFIRLRELSWRAYKFAKLDENGRELNLMTSMLFSAFCLEAFLNHVGQDKIPFWKPIKKLSPSEKLEVISSELGFKPDLSRRPFQTLTQIFKFRNMLVHAETSILSFEGEYLLEDGEELQEPLTEWENQINLEKGGRFLDDTREIIKIIATAAGYDAETILGVEIPNTIIMDLDDTSMPS